MLAAVGDLVGNWSWTVWLLIPLVVVLAIVTGLSLGPQEERGRPTGVERGVSRFLDSRNDSETEAP